MNKPKCTEARRCRRTTCYDCRRYLIDITATRMLAEGVDPQAVDQYRYSSINALAWEIPPVVLPPKPKARKAFTPNPSRNYSAAVDKLRVCGSREYASELLKRGKYTIAELHHLATLGNTQLVGRLKADLVSSLIENLVGFRLDHSAIMSGAKG